MVRKRILGFCLVVSVMLTLAACETFVPDPFDPRLPRYSEEGAGQAGAYLNGEVWSSSENYGWFYDYGGQRIYIEPGQKIDIELNGGDVEFYFQLDGTGITTLMDLKGRTFDLGELNKASVGYDSCFAFEGKMHIRNVFQIYEGTLGVAGTFGFTVDNADCGRIEVRSGRFDIRFNNY